MAMHIMITRDGDTIPKVAAMAPGTFFFLWPTKVATFTAIIPGVDWAMA